MMQNDIYLTRQRNAFKATVGHSIAKNPIIGHTGDPGPYTHGAGAPAFGPWQPAVVNNQRKRTSATLGCCCVVPNCSEIGNHFAIKDTKDMYNTGGPSV